MDSECSILLVDDCPEALAVLAKEFRGADFEVSLAKDGVEAWECFEKRRPDLIVTDVRMPRADGFDLLRQVRGVSDIPVILLTAYGEVPVAVSAMQNGANDYLRYPDDLADLLPKARKLIGDRLTSMACDSADSLEATRSAHLRSQRDELVRLMANCGGNVAEIARRLELTRGAVVYRLKKHGLMP